MNGSAFPQYPQRMLLISFDAVCYVIYYTVRHLWSLLPFTKLAFILDCLELQYRPAVLLLKERTLNFIEKIFDIHLLLIPSFSSRNFTLLQCLIVPAAFLS